MRRPNDRIGNLGSLDQFFLGHFRSEITTGKKTLSANDGQGDMVYDASGRFRGREITRGGFEELQNRLGEGRKGHVLTSNIYRGFGNLAKTGRLQSLDKTSNGHGQSVGAMAFEQADNADN